MAVNTLPSKPRIGAPGFDIDQKRVPRGDLPHGTCSGSGNDERSGTVVWGIVGAIIAAQLIWPDLTYGIPWLSYGRLRARIPTR
jgi:hypothetical protein